MALTGFGTFLTGRAAGGELTERACQRRVWYLGTLVVTVWGVERSRGTEKNPGC